MSALPGSTVIADSIRIAGVEVIRIGFAGLHLAGPGGWGEPRDRAAAIALVQEAVDRGIRLIDTADTLGPGVSEQIIAEALHPYPSRLVVATKAGMVRAGERAWGVLGRPEYLKQQAKTSALRLRLEPIPLFTLHRVDPDVPFDEQIGALLELREEGIIADIGLSAVNADQLRRAVSIAPIAAVQNHFNLVSRRHQPTLDVAAELGIPFVAYWGLGHGRTLIDATEVRAVAERVEATPVQVLIAWLLQHSPTLVAIPGTSSPAHLAQNLGALDVALDARALADLEEFASRTRPVPELPVTAATP